MARIAKRIGIELLWFAGAWTVGLWLLLTLSAGIEENSTRVVAGLPPLQNWPVIPRSWRFVVLLAPYALSLMLRPVLGPPIRRLLERPFEPENPALARSRH